MVETVETMKGKKCYSQADCPGGQLCVGASLTSSQKSTLKVRGGVLLDLRTVVGY